MNLEEMQKLYLLPGTGSLEAASRVRFDWCASGAPGLVVADMVGVWVRRVRGGAQCDFIEEKKNALRVSECWGGAQKLRLRAL